jgi:hypothetical protein
VNLERWLRGHFDAAGGDLREPDADLERVMQRGRRRRRVQLAAVTVNTLAVAVVAVLGFQALTRVNVEFVPAAPGSASPMASASPAPSVSPVIVPPTPAGTDRPTEATEPVSPVVDPVEQVAPDDLGEPVLSYRPGRRGMVVREDGETLVWSGRVDIAIPDNAGGVVLQSSRTIVWLPDADGGRATRLVQVAKGINLMLHGVDPDGTVIYSTSPTGEYDEQTLERFYAVTLAEGQEPRLIGDEGVFEEWYVGPVVTPAGRVIASCHLLCSLRMWPEDRTVAPLPNALYYGGGGKQGPDAAIEALAVTGDKTLLALIESNEMIPRVPTVVVLDAVTFEPVARLPLPVPPRMRSAGAVISMSGDGQRILVAIDAPRKGTTPQTTFLIDRALTDKPLIRRVDDEGVVQWLEPGSVRSQ